ncbi:DUF480 domain-containing protein [candidate division KSB1 bacterium]|nr:DUF480 domain-containing protein [candidate division KSB1 bacterium]
MKIELNDIQTRVLGCLMEKEQTTPEYYPLTLNSLTAACNQKSSRHPVVNFDQSTVARAVEELREKKLVLLVHDQGSRTAKYRHYLKEKLNLPIRQLALLTVLMLRGPQTPGELKNRTERAYKFDDLQEVLKSLQDLAEHDPPFVKELPRQMGRKENRFVHLFASEPSVEEEPLLQDKAVMDVRAENERIDQLEKRVAELETQLKTVTKQFKLFKAQFE